MEQLNEDNILYFLFLNSYYIELILILFLKLQSYFSKRYWRLWLWLILGKQSKHWKENKSLENWSIGLLSQYGHGCACCAKETYFLII